MSSCQKTERHADFDSARLGRIYVCTCCLWQLRQYSIEFFACQCLFWIFSGFFPAVQGKRGRLRTKQIPAPQRLASAYGRGAPVRKLGPRGVYHAGISRSVTADAVPALPEGEPSTAFRIRLTFPKKERHHCRAVGDARPYGNR